MGFRSLYVSEAFILGGWSSGAMGSQHRTGFGVWDGAFIRDLRFGLGDGENIEI